MLKHFMARWTAANTLGWGVSLSLGLILMKDNRLWSWAPTATVGQGLALLARGIATRLVVGTAQWIGWRNPAIRLAGWLAASTAGWIVVHFIMSSAFPLLWTADFGMGFVVPRLGGPITGLLVGLMMGLLNRQA